MSKRTFEFNRELKPCKQCGGSGVYMHRDGNTSECSCCGGSGKVWRRLTVIVDIEPCDNDSEP